jgi:hypothetical protein
MSPLPDLHQKYIAVTGKLEGFSPGDVEILLRARGAWGVRSAPAKDTVALIAATAEGSKQDKARALGQPVVLGDTLRAALGAPLAGWRQRVQRLIDDETNDRGGKRFAVASLGAPVPDATLARIEARIGFPLPAVARELFAQVDGASLLWGRPALRTTPISDLPVPWNVAIDDGGALWNELRRFDRDVQWGFICLLPVETVFFETWVGRVIPTHDPDAVLRLGKRKVKARDFYGQLFLFDAFHPFYQAGLWADREREDLVVVYGADHGADWTWSNPVSLEQYLEYLLLDLGFSRLIDPVNTRALTAAMHRVHPNPWYQLEPYAG